MTAEYFPEQTIRYRTYAKKTLVGAFNEVFKNHPDELIQRTKADIEFSKDEVDYPRVLVRFFERQVFNSGVGHEETLLWAGESDSTEVSTSLIAPGNVQLNWPPIAGAAQYKIYRGTASDQENQSFTVEGGRTSFIDYGATGAAESVATLITADLDTPQPTTVVAPSGQLTPGTYYYRVTALANLVAIKFQHYFYTADIEFAIYALSAYDRDLIADTVVQTIAMGRLEAYTNSFFERIYPSNELYPDADLHFINVNADQIQGFGETESETPWGAEDDLLYSTSYRVGIFGELYSLPPKTTYAIVAKILQYPYIEGFESPPAPTQDGTPWVYNY